MKGAREREAATREILEVISQSRDDDRPVFDAILHSAARLCGADSAGLLLGRPDGGHLTLVALRDPNGMSAQERAAFLVEINRVPMQMDPALHVSAQAICGGKVVHIADIAQTTSYLSGEPTFRIMVEEQGIRTVLSVPLFDATGPLGAINLHRREVRLFSDDEIALIQSFAAQAVIAIENVRQFRELQTRLEREAATREILSVISQSRDDDAPVFDVIVRNAARLCNAPMAWLMLAVPTPRTFMIAGYHGLSRRQIELGDLFELDPDPDAITGVGRAVFEAQTVQDADLAQTTQYLNDIGDMRMLVDVEGIRTRLCVPLISGGVGIGTILLTRREVAPFSADQIALVETFAAQAVIAIENVAQFRELQIRLAREAATREILEVISQSRDDDRPVLDVVLRKAAELCHASMAGLNIISEDRSHAVMVAEWGDHVTDLLPVGETVWPMDSDHAPSTCMREGRIVHCHDLADTDLYRSGDPIRVKAVDAEGIRTFLAVPLFSDGRTVSCITIYRREVRPFTPDEIALVETFAAQAVIAIENVRQFRELQTRLEREAATREILQVISQSRDDEQPVFDAILRNAARLCEATTGGLVIGRSSDTHWRTVAMFGADALPGKLPDFGLVPMDPAQSITARAIVSGETVHTRDILETQEYKAGAYAARIVGDEIGARVLLNVPLMQKDGALGAIELQRLVPVPFTQPQIELVQSFAAQAVIAIENVRQFRELQTRLAREAATREILEVISQSRDDDAPVFDAVLRNANRLCGTSMAYLVLGRPDDRHMTMAAYVNPHLPSEDSVDQIIAFANQTGMRMDAAEHFSARAIVSGEVVQIADLATSPGYLSGEPTTRILVEDVGVRTILSVPLFDAQGPIGAISLQRREERPFSDDEVALIQSFAAQAVIAIENVRQFRELQTRLAREAATREILEVISQSRDDDKPVFDVVLRKAADLCNASMASLLLITEDRRHAKLVADWGHGQVSGLIQVGSTVWSMESEHVPSTCMREGRIVHIHDMADTDLYRSGDPLRVAAVDEDGIRTFVAVPLFSGGQTVGCILVYRREVRPFTPDEIALVETFAAQAVIAIENVRQFRELQDALEQQEATSDILSVISQSREDDAQVFDLILEKATDLCDADQGSLHIVNEARTHIRLMADWGHDRTAWRPGLEISLDRPLTIVPTIRTGKVVHIEDYAQSDAYRDRDPIAVDLVDIEGVRTRLNVPLLQNGIAIGCISLSRRVVRPFSQPEIALVETFAAQAVIAIENARQFRELQGRLAREAATREILEVISLSRDDEQPVFEVVLRKAAELCHAPLSSLNIISEDRSHAVSVAEWGFGYVSDVFPVGRTIVPLDSHYATSTCLREGRVIQLEDMADTDLYRSGDPLRTAMVDQDGMRTFLAVPLFSGGQTVGCILVFRREVRPFTPDEIALVETFAAQAVIAIQNVRQFRELQSRLEREAATRDILEVISQSRDDNTPVFDMIAQNAARLCHADVCTFWRVEDGLIHYCASHGLDGAAFAEATMAPSIPLLDNTLTGQVAKTRAVARIDDAMAESYYDHEWARAAGVKQMIGVPIFAGSEVWGSISLLWRADQAHRDADIQLVESFAAQAAIAIENVRQFKALEALNAELGDRVLDQVGEIERMGRLKRFLPAAVADAVISSGSERMLKSHRALLGVLFCDIRGFTAFCETAEPEETIEVLQTYHEEMGKLIETHGAGVDHRMGDGIMVLFNDPLPCDDPAGDAVRLAMAMRARMAELCRGWKRMGYKLGFGLGASLGYATVGMVGSEGRFDYTASGTAINLASRLCDEAQDGEILVSPRVRTAVEDDFTVESRGEISFKGIREPVEVFCVTGVVG